MKPVYIVDALRTPIGKYGGVFSNVRPDDLLAHILHVLMQRNASVDITMVEDVLIGCANQAGEDNRNIARMALLLAGFPVTIAGATVNRLCASGMQAIMDAARAIQCEEGLLYIAGGVESMTRAPFVIPKSNKAWNRNIEMYDTTLGWRFINKKLAAMYYPYSMGETAENIAEQWNISREKQDEFALLSQQKYFNALQNNKWNDEIVPVEIEENRTVQWIMKDEQPRETTLSKLNSLPSVFKKNGTVTAGNSSGINDGASALLLAGETALRLFQLKPLAKIVSMAITGVHPDIMGIGPVAATQKALKRAGLTLNNIDLIELNEAFAAQSIACIQELHANAEIVNVNGGAIALGHPLGCSGARITTTLLYEMLRRNVRYGLATMCVGVGQGTAIILEKM